jgi:hypothetical protein
MACNPSDARAGGDVELVDVSLAEVTDGFGGVKGGKWERRGRDAVSEDSESEDEGKGLLPRGDAGASASTSAPRRRDASSHITGDLRGYITRVPKGEAVMLAATFTFAFQNVVAKRVERRVPPMEVVFVRSCISGAVTVFTTWRRVVECNAIVRKTNATDPDAPLDAPPGEDFETIHSRLRHSWAAGGSGHCASSEASRGASRSRWRTSHSRTSPWATAWRYSS